MRQRIAILCVAAALAVPLSAAESEGPLDRLQAHLAAARAALAARSPRLEKALDDLDRAGRVLDSSVAMIDRHMEASDRFLQQIGPCPGEAPQPPAKSMLPAPPENPPGSPEEARKQLEAGFDQLRAARNELHDALPKVPDEKTPGRFLEEAQRSLEAADQILSRERDAMLTTGWLQKFQEKRREIATGSLPCQALQDLPAPRIYRLSDLLHNPLLPLQEAQTRVERSIERRYEALQHGSWGVGAGVIWTNVKAPRYGAVPNPQNPSQLVVAQVGEDARADQPVLMAYFRPPEGSFPFHPRVEPYLEAGAGLQFDEPSFYVGGAIDVGPFLRVGVGWTAQQVEELANGQSALEYNDDGTVDPASITPVANSDAIVTRSDFKGGVYVSFTVKLDRILSR